VKHYLRGEEGCYYEDLWPLVKFLPAYALPNALPSPGLLPDIDEKQETNGFSDDPDATLSPASRKSASAPHLPLHASSSMKKRPPPIMHSPVAPSFGRPPPTSPTSGRPRRGSLAPPSASRPSNHPLDEPTLLPSRIPPQFSYFDVFPFSLLVKLLTAKGKELKGRKAARLRAKMGSGKRGTIVSHNVPLEITLYLVSTLVLVSRVGADVMVTELVYCGVAAPESD
jgi:putative membrane protein